MAIKIGINGFGRIGRLVFRRCLDLGNFEFNKNEYQNGRLNVPKIITEFYKHYFNLPNTNTFQAYVPDNLKSFDKEFLDQIENGIVFSFLISFQKQIVFQCQHDLCREGKEYRLPASYDIGSLHLQ